MRIQNEEGFMISEFPKLELISAEYNKYSGIWNSQVGIIKT